MKLLLDDPTAGEEAELRWAKSGYWDTTNFGTSLPKLGWFIGT